MLRSQRQNRVLASMESPVRIDAHSHRRRHSFFFLHAPPPWNAYSGVGNSGAVCSAHAPHQRTICSNLVNRSRKKKEREYRESRVKFLMRKGGKNER